MALFMKITRPNVFIIGVPKSAKVSIRHWLSQHPDVYTCLHDLDFFSLDVAGKQERVDSIKKYLSYFKEGKGKKIIIDQSTRLAVSQKAHQLIKKFNPKAKIIISIRNPADQMFSWHHTLRKIGLETESDFHKALIKEKDRKKRNKSGLIKDYFYRDFADYYPQIKRYIDTFGKKNVKVVLFDDLGKRDDNLKKEKVYLNLLKFLGLKKFKANLSSDKSGRSKLEPKNQFYVSIFNIFFRLPKPIRLLWKFFIPPEAVNKIRRATWKETEKKNKINPKLKSKINKSFEPNLKKLEKLINRDLGIWYNQKNKN